MLSEGKSFSLFPGAYNQIRGQNISQLAVRLKVEKGHENCSKGGTGVLSLLINYLQIIKQYEALHEYVSSETRIL